MFVLATLALVSPAHASTRSGRNTIDGVRFELHANADAWAMFGLGMRVEIPIVPQGFLHAKVRDELALSFGGDVFFAPFGYGWYDPYDAYAIPIAVVEWNFYLNDRWCVFPEAGLAFHLGFYSDHWDDSHWHGPGWAYAQPDLGVGARYHFNPRNSLVFRASTPGGLQVGFTF
jgi:hypothetical protein